MKNMLDEMIYALDVVSRAVDAQDKDHGFEAVTVLLVLVIEAFGHDDAFMVDFFPILKGLKDRIEEEDFDGAREIADALLEKFRRAQTLLARCDA